MKYIRTKDGEIYEVESPNPFSVFLCKPKHVEMLVCVGEDEYEMRNITIKRSIGRNHWKTEIIKQADTIKELCDVFVYKNTLIKINFEKMKFEYIGELLSWLPINDNMIKDGIYGAIWTDKGLIYVAKMNENGELELI